MPPNTPNSEPGKNKVPDSVQALRNQMDALKKLSRGDPRMVEEVKDIRVMLDALRAELKGVEKKDDILNELSKEWEAAQEGIAKDKEHIREATAENKVQSEALIRASVKQALTSEAALAKWLSDFDAFAPPILQEKYPAALARLSGEDRKKFEADAQAIITRYNNQFEWGLFVPKEEKMVQMTIAVGDLQKLIDTAGASRPVAEKVPTVEKPKAVPAKLGAGPLRLTVAADTSIDVDGKIFALPANKAFCVTGSFIARQEGGQWVITRKQRSSAPVKPVSKVEGSPTPRVEVKPAPKVEVSPTPRVEAKPAKRAVAEGILRIDRVPLTGDTVVEVGGRTIPLLRTKAFYVTGAFTARQEGREWIVTFRAPGTVRNTPPDSPSSGPTSKAKTSSSIPPRIDVPKADLGKPAAKPKQNPVQNNTVTEPPVWDEMKVHLGKPVPIDHYDSGEPTADLGSVKIELGRSKDFPFDKHEPTPRATPKPSRQPEIRREPTVRQKPLDLPADLPKSIREFAAPSERAMKIHRSFADAHASISRKYPSDTALRSTLISSWQQAIENNTNASQADGMGSVSPEIREKIVNEQFNATMSAAEVREKMTALSSMLPLPELDAKQLEAVMWIVVHGDEIMGSDGLTADDLNINGKVNPRVSEDTINRLIDYLQVLDNRRDRSGEWAISFRTLNAVSAKPNEREIMKTMRWMLDAQTGAEPKTGLPPGVELSVEPKLLVKMPFKNRYRVRGETVRFKFFHTEYGSQAWPPPKKVDKFYEFTKGQSVNDGWIKAEYDSSAKVWTIAFANSQVVNQELNVEILKGSAITILPQGRLNPEK